MNASLFPMLSSSLSDAWTRRHYSGRTARPDPGPATESPQNGVAWRRLLANFLHPGHGCARGLRARRLGDRPGLSAPPLLGSPGGQRMAPFRLVLTALVSPAGTLVLAPGCDAVRSSLRSAATPTAVQAPA